MASTPQTPTQASSSTQIAFHQRMAQLLHDHATWAAIAALVVLAAKYIFNLQFTEAEVLSAMGVLAVWVCGARWAQAAHINAMASIAASVNHAKATEGAARSNTANEAMASLLGGGLQVTHRYVGTPAPPADSSPPTAQ
jgi:hypothetical protein